MADPFTEIYYSMFGAAPGQAPSASSINLAGLGNSGAPLSPEAADPSTPSPQGNVLARLRTPGQMQPGALGANSRGAGSGSYGGGFGGAMAAGLEAGSNPHDSGWINFAKGFAGAQKAREDAYNQQQLQALAQQKQQIDTYKTLFDIYGKQIDQGLAQKKENAAESASAETRAENKRWHDIQDAYYKGLVSKKQNDALEKDENGNIDWEAPKNAAIASQIEDRGQRKFRVTPANQDALDKNITRIQNNAALSDDDKQYQIAQMQADWQKRQQAYDDWLKTRPWNQQKQQSQDAAPGAQPQPQQPAAPASPQATPQAGAAPAPAKHTWVPIRNPKTGEYALWNPQTKQMQPINSLDKSLPVAADPAAGAPPLPVAAPPAAPVSPDQAAAPAPGTPGAPGFAQANPDEQ